MEEKPSIEEALYLMHYGTKRHSGRYPWGSGEDPYQHSEDFLSRVEELKGTGMTDKEIADQMKLTTTEFRVQYSLATNARNSQDRAKAKAYAEKGLTASEIGRKMGKNESTIRGWLKSSEDAKLTTAQQTADILKKHLETKGWLDVGEGVDKDLNISKERLDQALYILERDGYTTYAVGFPQVTNKGQQTRMRVLTPPGTTYAEVYNNPEKINNVIDYKSDDGGDTYRPKFVYPASMDSSRLYIRYPDEGGNTKDGVIQIRRGVADLDLGESHYAQVRILVDNSKFLKGMAIYGDDSEFPDGVDVIFNTSKDRESHPGLDALKDIKRNKDGTPAENPFKSSIKPGIYDPEDGLEKDGGQSYYIDKDGTKKLSLINKKSAEGDWASWSDSLPSQFLSKQPEPLIRKQLDISKADKKAELDELMSLTNPTVRSQLLEDFAGSCDTNAETLKAAALPRQKYQVILPVDQLSDNEVYAPRYKDGETVALVRYPHGGTFEIPILKVNNKNPAAVKNLGDVTDAVGINSKVAERLSGADFDGDTVMVIPCNSRYSNVKIQSRPRLKALENFDNKMQYPEHEGMKIMKDTQKQMGVISNLITDMTLKGASEDEIARAVKHSMVVIDAEKHHLDYKQSEEDNQIASLKEKWQGHIDSETDRYHEGASTLISRAKSTRQVDLRQGTPKVNLKDKPWYDDKLPEGSLIYKTADPKKLYYVDETFNKEKNTRSIKTVDGRTIIFNRDDKEASEKYKPIRKDLSNGDVMYTNKMGDIYKMKKKTIDITAMANTTDARSLISSTGTVKEELYADYANYLKSLANIARKEAATGGKQEYDPVAKKTYAKERDNLLAQLNIAEKNAPRERKANTMAYAELKKLKEEEPIDKSQEKKLSQQILTKNRMKVGAKGVKIHITDKEWEAIQAGAISNNQLKKILTKAEPGRVLELALPKKTNNLSAGKMQKLKAMKASGHYTLSEIAESLGVSTTTVTKYLKEIE